MTFGETLPARLAGQLGQLVHAVSRFSERSFFHGQLVVTMTAAERVAERTWTTLGRAKHLRVRFGEETLTDLLVLDMVSHQRAKGFWLRPTTKLEEAWCGADLLVAVRHPNGLWSQFALQAKKLYPDDDRYRMLNRVQESIVQLEKLERFAQQRFALPLYLLYNHSNTARRSEHWHCPRPFDEGQLGCTLVPSWRIRQMLRPRSPRNFHRAHNINQSRPWRCAFDCPDVETTLMEMAYRSGHRQYDWRFQPMKVARLDELFRTSKTQLTRDDMDQIRSEMSESIGSDERLYPARLLIVDRSQQPLVLPDRDSGKEPG